MILKSIQSMNTHGEFTKKNSDHRLGMKTQGMGLIEECLNSKV